MLAFGGCTSSVGGVAAAPSTPSAPPQVPSRANELSLRDKDPCALLTSAQLDRLKENGAPRPLAKDVQRDGPTCAFDVDATKPTYTYYLELITTADLQDWLSGGHHRESMTQEQTSVAGFPALVDFAPSNGIRDCETLVGVAGGQTLRAEMAPDDESFSQQALCDMSTTLAQMAVETLETIR